MNIIKHCCKSYSTIIRNYGFSGNFDNPMGSYDSVELSELVGCFLLYKLNDIIDPSCYGL